MTAHKRGRGRPRREYRIHVRAERRETPDYDKLARALLEHAAMAEAKKASQAKPSADSDCTADTTVTNPKWANND